MRALLVQGWRAYVGNAAAVRDFRSQLRGNKAVWIWGSYLALLIALCGIAYSGIVHQNSQSIANLQQQLSQFYVVVISMLGAVISLAAPALTASTVTIERQRRSLDLIFSAPVSPRYLLIGKLIAGFRYLLMLLVLALPVTSVCVVMGGATWGDVLGAFLVLMSCGIFLMAIGLLISSLSSTTISAIISTYLGTLAYLVLTSMFATYQAAMTLSPISGSVARTNEAMWTVALSPFGAAIAAPTFTMVAGYEVPNWIFGLIFALAMSRLLLAGASSSLSHYGSSETKLLRIQGWIVAFLLAFLAAVPLSSLATTVSSMSGSTPSAPTGPSADYLAAIVMGIMTSSAFFLIPHVVCHSKEADRKYRPDGLFSIRKVFVGTPSGAGPYLFGLVICAAGGIAIGYRYAGVAWPNLLFLSMTIWSLGYYALWWGLGRYISSFKLGLRAARSLLMACMILVLAVPVPIMLMIMAARPYSTDSFDIWRLHLLYPLSPTGAPLAWVYGIGCALAGLLFAVGGEANLRRSESR